MSMRLRVLADTLKVAGDNDAANGEILSGLDDKAQRIGSAAGLFLAVPFALVKPDSLLQIRNSVGWVGLTMLMAATISFLLAILLSLSAVIILRRVPVRPGLNIAALMAQDLISLSDSELTEGVEISWILDQLKIWKSYLAAQEFLIRRKGLRLMSGLSMLLTGVLFISAFVIWLTYSALWGIPAL
jgi:hypothetical protein